MTYLLVSVIVTVLAVIAMGASARRETRLAKLATPTIFGVWVLWLWQAAVKGFGVPTILLPAPTAIIAALGANAGMLGEDFVQTVIRSVLPGYVLGCGAGFLMALAVDKSDFLKRGLMPLGNLVSAMPIIGIAPIAVMWFGFGWQSKAAVVAAMTFFPMLVNTSAGLAEAGVLERELMLSYAAPYATTLLKLRLPAALPHIFAALKLNTTLALIGAVVAEFFGSPILGLGFRISTEAASLNLDIVWAAIVIVALTGSLSFAGLALLERAVTFWHPSYRNPN
ncbi:ABC transporter permease [Acidocella sp.]|uniref:ABC transporter permease n=1 Tax=Acidocella sp. TaxID=50710 RepID=UPI003D00648D